MRFGCRVGRAATPRRVTTHGWRRRFRLGGARRRRLRNSSCLKCACNGSIRTAALALLAQALDAKMLEFSLGRQLLGRFALGRLDGFLLSLTCFGERGAGRTGITVVGERVYLGTLARVGVIEWM